jgi:hypothetical protein
VEAVVLVRANMVKAQMEAVVPAAALALALGAAWVVDLIVTATVVAGVGGKVLCLVALALVVVVVVELGNRLTEGHLPIQAPSLGAMGVMEAISLGTRTARL